MYRLTKVRAAILDDGSSFVSASAVQKANAAW